MSRGSIYIKDIGEMLLFIPGTACSRNTFMASTAGCWTADRKLCRILISAPDAASQHLVLKEGDITLRDPAAFEEVSRCAKLEASGKRISEIRNEHPDNGRGDGEFDRSRKLSRVSRQKALELL